MAKRKKCKDCGRFVKPDKCAEYITYTHPEADASECDDFKKKRKGGGEK